MGIVNLTKLVNLTSLVMVCLPDHLVKELFYKRLFVCWNPHQFELSSLSSFLLLYDISLSNFKKERAADVCIHAPMCADPHRIPNRRVRISSCTALMREYMPIFFLGQVSGTGWVGGGGGCRWFPASLLQTLKHWGRQTTEERRRKWSDIHRRVRGSCFRSWR